MKFNLVSLLLILFVSQEAWVSQIHYKKVTLDELVSSSSTIVLVKKANPFQTQNEIKLEGKGKEHPFIDRHFNFEVVEILRNGTPPLSSAKKIKVHQAFNEQKLKLHKDYYLKGISRSPIFQNYRDDLDAELAEDKKYGNWIIFLRPDAEGSGLQFTVEGALETESNKEKVKALIKD